MAKQMWRGIAGCAASAVRSAHFKWNILRGCPGGCGFGLGCGQTENAY